MLVFPLYGVYWVILRTLVDLLHCWKDSLAYIVLVKSEANSFAFDVLSLSRKECMQIEFVD